MPSASHLLQNRVNRAIWWHFKKWLQYLLPRDLIPCVCAICSVLLGCEIQPSQRHWAIAMLCLHPSPRSQVSNCVSRHCNYLSCHWNGSSQRWMLQAYPLMSWLRSLACAEHWTSSNWGWWPIPVIPLFRKCKQETRKFNAILRLHSELEASRNCMRLSP